CFLRVFLRNFSKSSVRDCCFMFGKPSCGQRDTALSPKSRINQRCPKFHPRSYLKQEKVHESYDDSTNSQHNFIINKSRSGGCCRPNITCRANAVNSQYVWRRFLPG